MPRLYRTERRTAASLVSYILIGRTMIYPYVSNWASRTKRRGAGRCDMRTAYQLFRIGRASTRTRREVVIGAHRSLYEIAVSAVSGNASFSASTFSVKLRVRKLIFFYVINLSKIKEVFFSFYAIAHRLRRLPSPCFLTTSLNFNSRLS